MNRLLIIAICSSLIYILISSCSQKDYDVQEKTNIERITAENKQLRQNERKLSLNMLSQQSYESTEFYFKEVVNLNTGQVIPIKKILNKERLVLYFDNGNEDYLITLLSDLYAFSEIQKPVIITDAMVYKTNVLLQKIDTTKIELYFSYTDDCRCKIPYKENLFFVLDKANKMKNVFIPSSYFNDLNIRYLSDVRNKYFQNIQINLPFMQKVIITFKNDKKDTIIYYKTMDYESLIKNYLMVNGDNYDHIFVNLNEVNNRNEFITTGRIYPYLTFIDSNLNVSSQVSWYDDLDIQKATEEYKYFIASSKSVDGLIKINEQINILE